MICTIIYIRTQYLYTNGGKFIINLFRMFALHVLLYCANSSGSLQTSSLSAVADGRRGIGPDSLNGTNLLSIRYFEHQRTDIPHNGGYGASNSLFVFIRLE